MNTPIISDIKVVGHEQTRELVPEYEVDSNGRKTGRIAKLTPTNERAFLSLQLPTGAVIRAEIAEEDFDRHVVPVLDRQFPEWVAQYAYDK